MYFNYLRGLEGHSEAKIDLPQLVNTVVVSKYVLLVALNIFIRPLYLFSNTNK